MNVMPDDAVSSFNRPGTIVDRVDSIDNIRNLPTPGTLYYGDYSDDLIRRNYSNTTLLIYCDRDEYDSPVLPADCNTIIVSSRADLTRMVRAALSVQNDIVGLGKVNADLLELVRSGGSLKDLLDYGSSVLRNPMLLVDVSFGYIASSGMENVDRDKYSIWYYTIEEGIMPADYISRIMTTDEKYIDEEEGDPYIIETYMDELGSRAYSIKVMQGGEVYGYIKVLIHNQELSRLDREVFLLLSKYAGIITGLTPQNINYSSDPAETLFTSLLLQRVPVDKAAFALKNQFSLKLFKNMYIVSIQFSRGDLRGDYLSFAHKRLKAFFRNELLVMIDGGFVVLYDTDSEHNPFAGKDSEFVRDFTSLLGEIRCTANVSFVFHSMQDVLRYYAQTNFCTEYRYMADVDDPILLYSEIYEFQMITALKDQVELRSLIHPAVVMLMDVDSTYGSDLTDTLFEYVNNHASITATAKSMYLHYNTVKHRLERIVSLTSFDENNKDEIFRIMLSQKIIEITSWDAVMKRPAQE